MVVPLLLLQGCIKDEPLELEADIVAVHDTEDSFLMSPILTNNKVVVYVKPGERDLTQYRLKFDLSKGATVSPASESVQNYKEDVAFTVTSQNGQYTKKYTVKVIETNQSSVPDEFNFDNVEVPEPSGDIKPRYHVIYDVIDGVKYENWSSGSSGYQVSLGVGGTGVDDMTPEMFPTHRFKDPVSGENLLMLETQLTGTFGAQFGAPISAGNHFIGSFALNIFDARKSTRFGLPFNRVPEFLEGSFSYTPGVQMTDKDLNNVDGIDECDIYAVLYNRKELVARQGDVRNPIDYLDGYTIHDDPSIVAIARIPDGKATKGDALVNFKVPFEYKKAINEDDVFAMDYNLVVIATSSKKGDEFIGAVGSKLILGNLKINTK